MMVVGDGLSICLIGQQGTDTDGWVIFWQSLAPCLEDLGDGRVIAEGAFDLGLGEDVVIAGSGIGVAEGGELFGSEGDEAVLLLRADLAELLDRLVDGLDHKGQDGVLCVVHLALGDALQCQFEDVCLDLGLVFLVRKVDALECLLHDGSDDLVLVDGLEGLSLFEDVFSTGVEVVLECELFGDEELGEGGGTLRRVLLRIERQSPWTDLYSICSLAVLMRLRMRTSVFSAQQVSTLLSSRFSSLRQKRVRKGSRKYFLPSSQKQLYAKQKVHAQVADCANMKKSSVAAMNRSTPSPPRKMRACLRAKLKCSQWGETGSAPLSSDSTLRVSATPEMTRLWGSLQGWMQARWVERLRVSPSLAVAATRFWNSWMLAAQRSVNLAKVFWATDEKQKEPLVLSNIIININIIFNSQPSPSPYSPLHSPVHPSPPSLPPPPSLPSCLPPCLQFIPASPPQPGVCDQIWYGINIQSLLPFLQPRLVESVGMGVTSSMRPILMPFLAMALRADWAPGPGALSPFPPRALSLMWTAVMLSCLRRLTMSMAACIAAQGEDSSRSALTFIPPVTRARVSRPVRSVTWMKVSFQVARMWQTAKTSPVVFWGPRDLSCLASAASSAPSSPLPPFFFCSFAGAALGSAAFTSAIISINILQIINIYYYLPLPPLPLPPPLRLPFTSLFPSLSPPIPNNNNQMISTRQSGVSLLRSLRFNKVSWTTGNPYNVRWQYKWRPAYYTYLRDGEEPTRVNKPEDSPAVRPPFYSYWQDALYRVFPSLKTIYFRSERYQDPFQIFVLPSLSIFFYQFWDLAVGFKGLTILPWMLFWTRIRDRTLDPDVNEVHLRDIIHQNPELGALFKPETIHLLDYDLEYDTGFPCEKKFPEFKNKFFRFFNNDTHMTTGFYKFGDLESGATMTLHVKTMPVHGEFRYQVGEPFYFYDLRAELTHNGQFKEIVIVDEKVELQKKRPFLIII